jgi:uncharacterized membrane protein
LALQKEHLIELGDAVIALKDDKGRVKLNQMMNLTAAGALSGAFWGMLIGLIFLMPLVGTALGAASGALGGALSDTGINDDFMKDAAQALIPGSAGLFLLIRKMTADKVLADLEGVGGTVLRTPSTTQTSRRCVTPLRATPRPNRRPSRRPDPRVRVAARHRMERAPAWRLFLCGMGGPSI